MAFRTVANLNFGAQDFAGNCLPMAQKVAGAGGGPVSATQAANATKFQHHDRNFPADAVAVVWFSHKGTYTNYITGQPEFGDWGHVVMRDPNYFGPGIAGYYSSPRNGYGGEWFRSVEEIEAAFNSSYRFWSEDINGVRVSEPASEEEVDAQQAEDIAQRAAKLAADRILDTKVPQEGSKKGKGQYKTLRQLIGWQDHQLASIKRGAEKVPALVTLVAKLAAKLGVK